MEIEFKISSLYVSIVAGILLLVVLFEDSLRLNDQSEEGSRLDDIPEVKEENVSV